jgi:hypothetical protein
MCLSDLPDLLVDLVHRLEQVFLNCRSTSFFSISFRKHDSKVDKNVPALLICIDTSASEASVKRLEVRRLEAQHQEKPQPKTEAREQRPLKAVRI